MRPRQDSDPVSLEVRALYSVAALARVANVNTYMLLRVLRANDVQFVRAGRALLVPLSEIRRKIPALWESLRAAEQLRRQGGERESVRPVRLVRPVRPGAPRTREPQG